MTAKVARPRDWIVRQALAARIEKEEERERLTWEALVNVDAGRVVGHEVVEVWAQSLSGAQRR